MNRLLTFAGIVSLLAMFATLAPAAELYDFNGTNVLVEYWAGTGSNEAILVVGLGTDYNDPSPYKAFGYRWNDTKYSIDMLQDVDAAGDFDATIEFMGFGNIMTAFRYQGQDVTTTWMADYLSAWNSTDGQNWSYAIEGIDQRELTDGDYDGWAYADGNYEENPAIPPVTPTPEPASMALLGIGAMGLLRKRRRK
jgi:hypothetical protein